MSRTPDDIAVGPAPRGEAGMPGSLDALLNEVAALADGTSPPSLEQVLQSFGPTGALPVMMTVALLIVSPLSGIPMMSTLAGLTIAGLAFQMALGRRSIWLPAWLRRRRVTGARLIDAIRAVRPMARFLDRHSRPRLRLLTAPPASRLVLLLCGLCGLSMPALELVPFTSSLLALVVACLGFSLLVRDGLWALVAIVPMMGAGGVLARVVL
jgi:hypothetical protein